MIINGYDVNKLEQLYQDFNKYNRGQALHLIRILKNITPKIEENKMIETGQLTFENMVHCESCHNEIQRVIVHPESGKILCHTCIILIEKCEVCENYHNIVSRSIVDGDSIWVCEDCADSLEACDHCGNKTADEHDVSGSIWCNMCFENDAVCCDACGDYSDFDYTCQTADCDTICDYCRENYYLYCEDCGDVYHRDEMYSDCDTVLCENCHNGQSGDLIRRYHDNPQKVFNRTDNDRLNNNRQYFGVEIEVEAEYNKRGVAQEIHDNYQGDESVLYLMEDGSLDCGFEVISQPCTLDFHQNVIQWNAILSTMRDYNCDAESHNCGLHVHVSKRGISDKAQVKIAYFINMYSSLFESLARRDSQYYCEYKRKSLDDNTPSTHDRYEAVNFQNSATIEFRIFQSTLELSELLASIELCHAVVAFCQSINANILLSRTRAQETFIKFVQCNKEYKYLPEYIASKIG